MKRKLMIAAFFVLGMIGTQLVLYSCTAAQQKTVLDVVHVSTHVCRFVAELKCKPALLALCEAGHDVSDQLREAVESDSTCPLDGGADGH